MRIRGKTRGAANSAPVEFFQRNDNKDTNRLSRSTSAVVVRVQRTTVRNFLQCERGTLRGFAKVEFPSGMIIHGIAIHADGRLFWATPPYQSWRSRHDGEARWSPVIGFASNEDCERWSAQVIEAMRQKYPNVVSEGAND